MSAVPRKNPAAVALGRKGGKVRSDAKADAARANGATGGRPSHLELAQDVIRLHQAGYDIDDPDAGCVAFEQAALKLARTIIGRPKKIPT